MVGAVGSVYGRGRSVWQKEECVLVEEGRGGGVCVERERKDVLFVGFGVVT